MYAHPSGQWARKIRGKLVYFGVWADPIAALERHNRQFIYLREGRTPPADDDADGLTVADLVEAFLVAADERVKSGDMSPITFRDYHRCGKAVVDRFGEDRRVDDLRPDDFAAFRKEIAERRGIVSLQTELSRIRVIFRFALKNEMIDKPVSFGSAFANPSDKAMRRHRNAQGPKLFERADIHRILDASDVSMRAMVLLGVNCAFGNSDVAKLPLTALDLDTGWVVFPRPKTEIPRRIPLWPATVDALRLAIDARPKPATNDEDRLVFLTKHGRPWVRISPAQPDKAPSPIDALSPKFIKLLKSLGINGRRGLGFYTLRHCFETYAGESKDQVAVDACMGHTDSSMAANYRHRISDERLLAVVGTVRTWLFGGTSDV